MDNLTVSRREFLKAGGSLVVTFSLSGMLPSAHAQAPAGHGVPKSVALDLTDGFLAIDAQGNVTVYSGKVDLGTGIRTAMKQIAADELDAPYDKVTVVQGDTLLTPDQGITWGSLSIQIGGMQLRRAAATARLALVEEAAKRLNVPAAELSTQDGAVVAKSGQRVAYTELLGGQQLTRKVDPKVALKDPKSYTIVGKPMQRVDIPAKVTGEFEYAQDFRLPGMLHARVIRPAGMKSQLQSVDDGAARKIPGFVATVRKDNFLAVVAKSEWGAIRASRAVRAQWSKWAGLPDRAQLWEHVRNSKVISEESFQNTGDAPGALQVNHNQLVATYDFAIHTHGSMGPSVAVAEWKGGNLTVWTPSQATHLLRKQLAKMLGTSEAAVRCIYLEGAGCYGRNGHEDAAADAALIAREVGQPVRVQWMREDEHGWDPKGPPTLIDYRAALDDKGNVIAWQSLAYLPNRPKEFPVTLLAAEFAGLPKDDAFPGNIHQALAIPYNFPNIRAGVKWLAETPFRPSWIRTPGRMQNTFGNETFMDELAGSAGIDPLEFRRRNLTDKRGLECLERAAKLANWQPRGKRARDKADIATGRGISYIKYELVRTYVAVVADVEVNRRTGKVRVTRFYVAHDCGQIINPDGLKNQLEGNIVQTVSRTLLEELKFDRSRVTSLDWASYPILRFPDVPEVVMDLIDRPNEAPWGAGEPAAAVVPSAISNAIFDAVGVRLRSVPFTPDKVLAALKKA